MAVDYAVLPEQIKAKIARMKSKKIRGIYSQHYPQGNIVYTVLGTDENGRNYCKIFTWLGG